MTEQTTDMSFSRRNFIKGAAALTAVGALAGCSPAKENLSETGGEEAAEIPETQVYAGCCRSQCLNACLLNVHVRDGQIVRTTARDLPNPAWNRICPKGLSHPERVYSSERVKYPMRRVGARGTMEFERISWDEAIEEITTKWKSYSDEYGPQSIAMFTGSGNGGLCGGSPQPGSGMLYFQNLVGFSTMRQDRDNSITDRMAKMLGGGAWSGGMNPEKFGDAKTLVIWGSNPVVSEKQLTHFILEAKESGTQIISVDIAYNTMVSKADKFIPVFPSSDGALALGALREIFEQGWQDEEFIRDHTEAPFLVKDDHAFLRMSDLGVEPTIVKNAKGEEVPNDPCVVWDEEVGAAVSFEEAVRPALEAVPAINGISAVTVYELVKAEVEKWTVESASEACGVPADEIRELARIYAQEGPVMGYLQFGINQYNNGTYSYGCIYALHLITGNLGKPGAGAGMCGVSAFGNSEGIYATPDKDGNLPQGPGPLLNWNTIYSIQQTGKRLGEPFVLKSFYVTCSNPIVCQTEHLTNVKMFEEIEFVVVQDMTFTETARYADIILPACHWFECVDIHVRALWMPYLKWNDKAIDPLYESKPDFEIYKLLAAGMGYGDQFDWDEEEHIRKYLDDDGMRQKGITLESLKEQKAIWQGPQVDYAFEGGVFGTPTKRARFYQENPAPDMNWGQEFDPEKERLFLYWEPALEAHPALPIREKYPFSVCSDHMRTRTHTQWWDVHSLKEFESQPIVRINPLDAEEYGISEGDEVKLYNDRGYAVLVATINAGQQRGALSCPRSYQAWEFIDGNTADISFNEYNQACADQSYNDVAVAIEKM